MQTISEILGHDGPFSHHLPGYAPRQQQQEMAEQVAQALEQHSSLVVEAGTGTGKTFAYLVPALLCGEKVIISTGTKNLQDQLFSRDLPLVRKALNAPLKVALLKGRSNYLCDHRLDRYLENPRFRQRQLQQAMLEVQQWAKRTQTGDIAELKGIPEDSPIWPFVTSTADNCLGQDCPRVNDCCVMKARKQAQEADLVVVNHHLFFADLSLREEGVTELLPSANGVIFDEAHQLPEVAANFFGTTFGSGQLLELAGDVISAQQKEAPDMAELTKLADELELQARQLRPTIPEHINRLTWKEAKQNGALSKTLERAGAALTILLEALQQAAERGKELERCAKRAEEIRAGFQALTGDTPEHYIHWLGAYSRSVVIHLTPMDIAGIFKEHMQSRRCAWVFTSATLTVDGGFDHFCRTLGIENAALGSWGSPFDYMAQSLLYIPPELPEPAAPDYTEKVVEAALPVLQASRGRAFMLFTSHRALQQAARLLADKIDYPILIQGEMPRSQLLARFRELGNGVLLGTSSFWEGVDVRGEALSCVVIDKLPFASPGDPIVQARIDAIRESGGNPFRDYQLPQAVITLKQGVGRLIRDVNDRGVMMICDPRTLQKSYGKTFINSLPRMKRTRNLRRVQEFFEQECPGELA